MMTNDDTMSTEGN